MSTQLHTSAQLDLLPYLARERMFTSIREQLAAWHDLFRGQHPRWAVLWNEAATDRPFSARLWVIRPRECWTDLTVRAATLDELRRLRPDTLTTIPRVDTDPAQLVEIWL